MAVPIVHGTCDDRFLAVKHKLQQNLANNRELGASICVNLAGTNVIDIWGGHANASRTLPWSSDTIVNIWSTSKNIISLAALLLIDRGLLDPNEKVAKYWPEFGVNGKEEVRVRHFLSHASGVSGWDERVSGEDVCEVEKTTKMLEQQAPWWTPGTQSGYHSLTMGHLIGALVQRITNKSLGQFIQDELCTPLDADFQFGAKLSDWARVAEIIPPPPMVPNAKIPEGFKNPASVMFKTLTNPPLDAKFANTETWRNAELGAANGHSNARGVARILSVVALGGTVDGKTFLGKPTIERIFEEQTNSLDLVVDKHIRFGLGFGITSPEKSVFPDWAPEGRIATWGGWGGSVAVMDVDRGLTIAYVMNRMEHSATDEEKAKGKMDRLREYIGAVYQALGVEV